MAHWLRDRGFEAYAVRGGVAALAGDAPEQTPADSDSLQAQAPRVLAALRWAPFRRYSAGVLISLIGSWVEAAAYGYVVLLLGGSATTLGLIGFLNTIPNLVFAVPAGALADRFDRRTLLLIFQALNGALAVVLATTWATGTLTVGLLAGLAVLGGILGTLSFPPFQAMIGTMVPRGDLESAVAINSLSLQVARFAGPAIAGFLLAAAGPTWVFGANAVSFIVVIATLLTLPRSRPARTIAAETRGAISAVVRYVFGQRSLGAMMILLLIAGLFAAPPVAFMVPALVRDSLHGGAGTLGVILAGIGLGSLLGSVALLRLSSRPNKGEPLIAGLLLTGAALAGIGASTSTWLSARARRRRGLRRRALRRAVDGGRAVHEQRRDSRPGPCDLGRSFRRHAPIRSVAHGRPDRADRPRRRRLRGRHRRPHRRRPRRRASTASSLARLRGASGVLPGGAEPCGGRVGGAGEQIGQPPR